jgi:hypothetical protein
VSEIKKLKFADGKEGSLRDEFNLTSGSDKGASLGRMRGRVVMKDEDGNIILEKDNLIVLRGRTFALEQLFNDPIVPESNYRMNLNRKICLFMMGSGGADVQASPFNPYTPKFSNEALGNREPFIILDPNKLSDPEKANNPSYVEAMNPELSDMYFDGVPDADDPSVVRYYAKKFETEPTWEIDKLNDEVYKKILLRVSPMDLRYKFINELCLCFAEYDAVTNTYKDIELFSRITFDTESLNNLTKQIIVEYYVYA